MPAKKPLTKPTEASGADTQAKIKPVKEQRPVNAQVNAEPAKPMPFTRAYKTSARFPRSCRPPAATGTFAFRPARSGA